MLWKFSPVDVLGERLDDLYYLLKRKAIEGTYTDEIVDIILKLANYEAIPNLYYKFIESLITYNILLEYINTKYGTYEDAKFLTLQKIEVKTKRGTTMIKINRPITFLLEIAILGTYVTSRLVNPYAASQLKAVLASLFYDMFIYKLKKIKELLNEGKVEEAKKMIDFILEVDYNNIFNQIVPLPSLIEFVNIEKIKHDSEIKTKINKELTGRKPKELLYIFPYLAKAVKEDEMVSYTAKKLLEATQAFKSSLESIKKQEELRKKQKK